MKEAQPDGRLPERLKFENSEPWDKDLPADFIPAIEHLRESFDEAHWGCGQTTRRFCYAQLHYEKVDDPTKEHITYFMHMKTRIGVGVVYLFDQLMKMGTPSALFKGFYDLYLEGTSVQALQIFKDLEEIGRANQNRLTSPYLEWAEAQTKHLIRSHSHKVENWIREVCDERVYDPKEDREERIFWRKWQAPLFLTMKPFMRTPYDAATAWNRMDAELSATLLGHLCDHYVLHLEIRLRKAAGERALELAKNPVSTRGASVDSMAKDLAGAADTTQQQTNKDKERSTSKTPNNVRREARKLDTQAIHGRWQKEYRRLKKSHGGMSDVWYSQKIAKSDIADGRSAETIRKHMTK